MNVIVHAEETGGGGFHDGGRTLHSASRGCRRTNMKPIFSEGGGNGGSTPSQPFEITTARIPRVQGSPFLIVSCGKPAGGPRGSCIEQW